MAIYDPSSSKKAKHKGKKHAHGLSGLLSNAWGDIKDLRGIPAGLMDIGESGAHDVGQLFAKVGSNIAGFSYTPSYQSDDIAKAIWGSYAHTYGPAFHGQWNLFGKRLYAHPLSPVLDAATAVTGGAGALGKVGATAAKVGGASSRLGRAGAAVAGLERVPVVSGPSLIKDAREVVSRDGTVFRAKTRPVTNSAGAVEHEIMLPRNPIIRARVRAKERLYESTPGGSHFHPDQRGPRLRERQHTNIAKRKRLQLENAVHAAVKPLNKWEREAVWWIGQGINSAHRMQSVIDHRAAQIKHLEDLGESGRSAIDARNLAALRTEVKTYAKVLPHIEAPTKRMERALDATEAAQDLVNELTIKGKIRAGIDEDTARAESRANQERVLHHFGIEPEEGERLITISHFRERTSKQRRQAMGTGQKGVSESLIPESRASSLVNLDNAMAKRDPLVVLRSLRRVSTNDQRVERSVRMLDAAVPYNHELHADAVADGTLKAIPKDAPALRRLQEINQFVQDNVSPLLEGKGDDLADEELIIRALKEATDKIDASDQRVIPHAAWVELTRETKHATGLVRKLNETAINQWRHVVLSLKGTFYVNNFLGNLMLGLIAHPFAFTGALVKESLGPLRGKTSKAISKAAPDAERSGVAHVLTDAQSKAKRLDLLGRAGTTVARHGAKLTDDNFRRAAIRVHMNSLAKRVRMNAERIDGTKLSRGDAVEMILNDERAVQSLVDAAFGDLLDYSKMTEAERTYLIPLMPFWAFSRSMAGRTIRLTLDEPWKMQVLELWGHHGIEVNADRAGELPDYLAGIILGKQTGASTFRGMTTYGSNPFTAPVDTAGQLLSAAGVLDDRTAGGTNPMTSFHPLIKSGIEAMTGKDLFYGSDLPQQTMGGRFVGQLANNLPPWVTYQKMSTEPGRNTGFVRTPRELLAGYFGAPIGTLDTDRVRNGLELQAWIQAQEDSQRARKKAKQHARHRDALEGLLHG